MATKKGKESEPKSEKGKSYRSSNTGKFVSKEYAKKHPKASVQEKSLKKSSGDSKRPGSRTGGPKKA